MMPTRYLDPKPARVKPKLGEFAHVSAPLKGLSKSTKLTPGDPLTATILVNWVIEDDRIQCRPGFVTQNAVFDAKPVEGLIPHHGVSRLLAAGDGKLADAISPIPPGTHPFLIGGFASNDWSWTSFANLSQTDYTVMCNGVDGVWSWDGGLTAELPLTSVVSISKANPAVVTVGSGDIGRFHAGQTVIISGVTGPTTAPTQLNKPHTVGTIAGSTFTLAGVDTTGLPSAPAGTAIKARPLGSIVKEDITGDQTWIVPDQFQIVLAHQNRLWFADGSSLAVFYLDLQSKSGVAKAVPLNAYFRRGGTIRAMATWTTEGGVNMNDQLCVWSSNGELAIFNGIDPGPDGDFQLTGIFRFDSPMSKHCVANWGGDLYAMISTGLVPMSTMLKAEQDQLGTVDRNVISLFREHATAFRDTPGWAVTMNPSSGRLICNVPHGVPNGYHQYVRHMPAPVWTEWGEVPSRCWCWLNHMGYFGDDDGNVYRMHPTYLSDDGLPIFVDVQMSWSLFKAAGLKQFKMLHTYMISSGDPQPLVDVKVDYDYSDPVNKPERITTSTDGAYWDEAIWDVDYWAGGEERAVEQWNGVASLGRVAGPRLQARIKDCTFAITGWDVLFEPGAAI